MDAALAREKSKHQAELSAFETELKQNFNMEMQIERDKHREVVSQLTAQHKQDITRVGVETLKKLSSKRLERGWARSSYRKTNQRT